MRIIILIYLFKKAKEEFNNYKIKTMKNKHKSKGKCKQISLINRKEMKMKNMFKKYLSRHKQNKTINLNKILKKLKRQKNYNNN